MNVFATDHPMASEPSAFARRLQRRLLRAAAGYLLYAFSLGPMSFLAGQGVLDFIPEPIARAFLLPAQPLVALPGTRALLRNYLDWWYHDPCDPYSSPDWM